MTTAISVRGLEKRYRAARVLHGVDFDIAVGDVAVLVGGNGAGKTTLIRILTALTFPTSGAVEVLGRPPGGSPDSLAVLFEDPVVYPHLRVKDNLRLLAGRSPRSALPEDLLELAGVAGFLDRRGRALSFGQRRRVTLAALLWRDSPLVVLDEPTNGLDPDGVAAFQDIVRRMRGVDRTILITGQDLGAFDNLATTVLHLSSGVITVHDRWQDRRQSRALTLVVRTGRPDAVTRAANERGFEVVSTPDGVRVKGDRAALQELAAALMTLPGEQVREVSLRESNLADLLDGGPR